MAKDRFECHAMARLNNQELVGEKKRHPVSILALANLRNEVAGFWRKFVWKGKIPLRGKYVALVRAVGEVTNPLDSSKGLFLIFFEKGRLSIKKFVDQNAKAPVVDGGRVGLLVDHFRW